MTIADIHPGDRLVHRTNALLSGWVRGVDPVGTVRPEGPCVWLDRLGRGVRPWDRIGESELAEYTIQKKELGHENP